MNLKISPTTIRIAIDLDDTIFDWIGAFRKKYPKLDWNNNALITKKVRDSRYDKLFWENLPLLERPNFEPTIYATKRINSKIYTRNCLLKYDLPIKPIYQIYTQLGNKASIIKGRCDVLIDDSIFNVQQALDVGLPAILIDRPHNQNSSLPRIYHLDINEIISVYDEHYRNC